MSRYPAGTGKRPNQRKKKKVIKAQSSQPPAQNIEQLKKAELTQNSGDFDSNMDQIAAEIAAQTAQNLPPEPPKIEPIEQKATVQSEDAQIIPFDQWRPPTQKQIESFKGLASMACGGVDMVSVSWRKNEAAAMEADLRDKAEGILAEIMAIYMPEATSLSPKQLQTLLLVSGLIEVGRQHYMRCLTIQPASIAQKKNEPNQSTSPAA